MSGSAITSWMLLFFGAVVILIVGQHILIPFITALLVYFLIRYVTKLFDRVGFVERKIPLWLKHIVATVILFILT
jgi:AI-2 transport protein TqsA